LDEGSGRIAEVELATPERGVWIPPYVWGGQTYLDPDAVLFVAASDPYDAADYIVDYDEFSLLVAQLPRESP
jgi:dTDP-4-dehydrorhamnose 3,5-epimerase-like enzyme